MCLLAPLILTSDGNLCKQMLLSYLFVILYCLFSVLSFCQLKLYILLSSGLNVQHDANHGAISMKPKINRFFGATQNWIGGSAISWIHQHVVQVANSIIAPSFWWQWIIKMACIAKLTGTVSFVLSMGY